MVEPSKKRASGPDKPNPAEDNPVPKGSRSLRDKALSVNAGADALLGLLSEDTEDSSEEEGSLESNEDLSTAADGIEEVEDLDDDDAEFEDDEEFEEDDEELLEEEELEDDESLYEVVVDGETLEVPLSELIAGYSRHADYTRKTQELAKHREELQQVRGEYGARAEAYGQRLDLLEEALAEQYPQEPDWDRIRAERPEEYPQLWADWQQQQQKLNAIQQERERVRQEQFAAMQQQYQERIAQEQQLLLKAVPEWAEDENARREELGELIDYAMSEFGYTEKEAESVDDHRAILMLRKAKKFDDLMANKGKLRKKKKGAKTIKPGSRQRTSKKQRRRRREKQNSEQARERLSRSGHVRDAAAAIKSIPGLLD